jgi:hypothetical protein
MYGACPICASGDDRFHVKGSSWFCRHCSPILQGRGWHDPIEFIMKLNKVDFVQAATILGGNLLATEEPQKVARTVQKPQKGHEDPAWVKSSSDLIRNASGALVGSLGASYASERGLTLETLQAFNVGYWAKTPLPGTWDARRRAYIHPQQPGLVIPWYDWETGDLHGIRYRYLKTHSYRRIEGKMNTVKQHSKWKSDFTGVFGSQALEGRAEDIRTLVICEGELNAMSIWQVANPWRWAVLSVGSESSYIPGVALEYAKCFGRVLVWMDRREHATRLMSDLGAKAYGVTSPLIGGEKVDANDYLKLGLLAGWLIRARGNACQSATERERFYYDVQEAHELYGAELDIEGHKAFGELAAKVREEGN